MQFNARKSIVTLLVIVIALMSATSASAQAAMETEFGSMSHAFPTGLCSDPLLTSVTIAESCEQPAADVLIIEKKTQRTSVTVPTLEVSDPPADQPAEKTCKNKNSGKDGTPGECNAGGGQEKDA